MRTFGVFCKHPQPGERKSQLAENVGPELSDSLNQAFLDDLTLEFRGVGERRVLGFAPADAENHFEPFSRFGYHLWPQPDGDLGERMSAFFTMALQADEDCAVLIRSDCPTIPIEYVMMAFKQLEDVDCVIGPATGGGYYLVGLRRPIPDLFRDISWQSSSILSQTVQRIADSDLTLSLLPPWYDIDNIDDLWMLAGHVRAMTRSGVTHPCPLTAKVLERLQLGP